MIVVPKAALELRRGSVSWRPVVQAGLFGMVAMGTRQSRDDAAVRIVQRSLQLDQDRTGAALGIDLPQRVGRRVVGELPRQDSQRDAVLDFAESVAIGPNSGAVMGVKNGFLAQNQPNSAIAGA